MDIHDTTIKMRDEGRAEHTHKARQQDVVGRERVDTLPQRPIEGLPALEVAVRDGLRRNPLGLRPGESLGIRPIGYDGTNVGR